MKKRLYRDLAKRGPGRASSGKNISLPNGMGLTWFGEGFQFPTFGSNRKRATARGLVWPRTRYRSLHRGRDLAEKVRAGLSIYAHEEDASKLRRGLDQRELMEILSL